VDFRGTVRVVIGYVECEFVGGISPETGVGCYGNFKFGQVVRVWEVRVCHFASIKFSNVCKMVSNVGMA